MIHIQLFRKKSIDKILAEPEEPHHGGLKKILSAVDLTAIGIGCIIGTGIFVLTGVAAIKYAGPGIVMSFVISGLACVFAALSYAEFASLIPIAGSAYTYGYATLGEIFAWIIGWDLILEYAVAASAVAIGWSNYFYNILNSIPGLHIPAWAMYIKDAQHPDGFVNIGAAVIVLLITWLLVVGIKESATVNSIIVAIKLGAALFFIAIGAFLINPQNWHPFIPNYVPSPEITLDPQEWPLLKHIFNAVGWAFPEGFGGWAGVMTAAAIIFFAYIGFDAVSTTAEEAKNPKRDLPIGIIASLTICTVLYIAVSAIFTGMVHCDGSLKIGDLGAFKGAPLAYALNVHGMQWASIILSIGAICGITSVLLVTLLGQSRIFFAMSRDKLLPHLVSKIHPKFRTPYITTIVTGVVVAVAAAFTPIEIVAELANIGTLFAFVIVCAGVIILRKMGTTYKSAFLCPGYPIIPILGIIFSVALMLSLPERTWVRFVVWLMIGFTFYFSYGIWKSELHNRFKTPVWSMIIIALCAVGTSLVLNFSLIWNLATAAAALLLIILAYTSWKKQPSDLPEET